MPDVQLGEVPRAKRYELVVYRAGGDTGAGESGVEETAELVFRKSLPGSVESWTPSLERCLTASGRYACSVRAIRREGLSDWSEMRLFRVAAGPSHAEFEEALEVVRRYLDRGGKAIASDGAAAENSLAPEAESTGSGAEAAPAPENSPPCSLLSGRPALAPV